MSAILSASDLNDFISPGVACIKPVETLPKQAPSIDPSNPYEVTTEDKVPEAADAPPAQISLTDCLACSGCVTSAEAVLVSLQSHNEVLNMLDAHPAVHAVEDMQARITEGEMSDSEGRIFVASVSPQTRASIAATYGVTERQAGNMISQLLSGEHGLKTGGKHGSSFTWVIDTNTVREICQAAVTEEALRAAGVPSPFTASSSTTPADSPSPKLPILASACPGWICYAEKTHPHVLPHLSALRSPQAMSGVLLKSVLSRCFKIPPSRIYHVAIMPCFDKKLEASREELTDVFWNSNSDRRHQSEGETKVNEGIRDTDTVITARELLTLAEARGISFPLLPRTPVTFPAFPDSTINSFLYHSSTSYKQIITAGPSGGYAYTILTSLQHSSSSTYAHSTITTTRGRNADVIEYTLLSSSGQPLLRTARYYGFRNIQNLVRRLKPARASRMPGAAANRAGAGAGARRVGKLAGAENKRGGAAGAGGGGEAAGGEAGEFAYIEVMACPGGCTNGGGQIKVDDVGGLRGIDGDLAEGAINGAADKMNGFDDESTVVGDGTTSAKRRAAGPTEQKEWLKRVDEAYYSASSSSSDSDSDSDTAEEPLTNGHGTSIVNGTKSTHTNGAGIPEEQPTTSTANAHISIPDLLHHWTSITDIPLSKLLYTTYRQVESDVGKEKANGGGSDMERVAGLASSLGGGW